MEELKKTYSIRYWDKGEKTAKKLVLADIAQYEMEAANKLIEDLKIQDTGDIVQNALNLNLTMSKNGTTPKLCSIILHEEDGTKYPEEFFLKCIAKDLIEPVADFFGGEGSFLLAGITSIVFSPLLKKMQDQSSKS